MLASTTQALGLLPGVDALFRAQLYGAQINFLAGLEFLGFSAAFPLSLGWWGEGRPSSSQEGEAVSGAGSGSGHTAGSWTAPVALTSRPFVG